jgi:hypothetical protein
MRRKEGGEQREDVTPGGRRIEQKVKEIKEAKREGTKGKKTL